jgi:hypothetical protein
MRIADLLAMAEVRRTRWTDSAKSRSVPSSATDGRARNARHRMDFRDACVGRDDRSCEVWMRRRRCATGHWYASKPWHSTGTSDAQ